jgi:hypothetical protein
MKMFERRKRERLVVDPQKFLQSLSLGARIVGIFNFVLFTYLCF